MSFFFFFNDTATTEIYTLSLHDALPICADGRGDPGGLRRRWADAADARAYFAGAPGGGALHRGVSEQGRHGGRQGAPGAGGGGGEGAAVEVRFSGGQDPDRDRQRAQGPGGRGLGAGHQVGAEAGRGARLVYSDAEEGDRQAVPDAGGGRVLDLGPGDGGDRKGGARGDQGGR